jgi:hypothetical protein
LNTADLAVHKPPFAPAKNEHFDDIAQSDLDILAHVAARCMNNCKATASSSSLRRHFGVPVVFGSMRVGPGAGPGARFDQHCVYALQRAFTLAHSDCG